MPAPSPASAASAPSRRPRSRRAASSSDSCRAIARANSVGTGQASPRDQVQRIILVRQHDALGGGILGDADADLRPPEVDRHLRQRRAGRRRLALGRLPRRTARPAGRRRRGAASRPPAPRADCMNGACRQSGAAPPPASAGSAGLAELLGRELAVEARLVLRRRREGVRRRRRVAGLRIGEPEPVAGAPEADRRRDRRLEAARNARSPASDRPAASGR